MGNPYFAISPLKKIIESQHDLVAIISNPPKPMGRKKVLKYTDVGKFALDNNIKLIELGSFDDQEIYREVVSLNVDLFIVVAYRILPTKYLEIPKFGAINIHASLLPKYRGAAPIQWALMNGDSSTGVTVFQINRKVDTGDILFQKKVEILSNDNMLTLGTRLCEFGARFIIDTIDKIEDGSIQSFKQNQRSVTFAPKITKEMLLINWKWPSSKIHNWVRGLSPYPGMYTSLKGKSLRIYKTFVQKSIICKPGEIIEVKRDSILVGTGKNLLGLLEVQAEGKKRLLAEAFIKGANIRENWVFGK